MKQKTITLPHCELLVVEVPKEAKNVNTSMSRKCLVYDTPWSHVCADLPEGNWQHLGAFNEVTEEQASTFVVKSIHTGLYAHYVKCIPVNTYCYKESADSLYSLLQANDWGGDIENTYLFTKK